MLKSLYSGVTGMRSQQTKMDVISNNIANVSTTGFKAGRVRFQDLISQIDAPAQGANANLGGINPHQIGMGVQVSGTDTIMTAGSLQTTGRSLDFGIQNGDNSFFMVRGESESPGTVQYTRDGGFYTDNEGTLVTASGMRVMGYTVPSTGIAGNDANTIYIQDTGATDFELFEPTGTDLKNTEPLVIHEKLKVGSDEISLQSFNIDSAGTIIGTYDNGKSYVLGRVGLANFSNPDGLEKAGGNLYNDTANSGAPQQGLPAGKGYGQIRSGFLEMSNVDLANEFTEMIVTSRAYQANSRSITTSDEMIQELLSLKR